MNVLFNGRLHVHYMQAYVLSDVAGFFNSQENPVSGQTNGICGARIPGTLFLTTGLHTGTVNMTVEAHDAEPKISDEWEDVVEVSFKPSSDEISLVQWAGEAAFPLALSKRDYRVRYSCFGMDRAREADSVQEDEPAVDRYLLQFWPDEDPREDAILRQTSATAAYWHRHAQSS